MNARARVPSKIVVHLLVVLLATWQVGQPLRAATFVWNIDSAGPNAWNTSGNWTTAGFPSVTDDIASLTNNITANQTINLNRSVTLGTLNIGDVDGTHTFTLAAGTAGSLIMDVTSGQAEIVKAAGANAADTISAAIQFNDTLAVTNNSTTGLLTLSGGLRSVSSNLSFNGAGAVTASGLISTAGNLTKNDAGTLTLSAANTYAGSTTVNGGTLKAGIAAALPARTALTIASGATFDYGGVVNTIGSLSGAGTVANTGAAAILTIGRDDTSSTFTGRFTQTTALNLAITKIGAGTLTWQPQGAVAMGTFTGNTVINGGTLVLDPSASTLTTGFLGATPLQIIGGNFQMMGRSGASVSQTVGALTVGATGGAITLSLNGGAATSLTTGTVTATASGGVLLVNAPSGTTFKVGSNLNSTSLNGRLVFTDGTANTFNWAYNNNASANAVTGFLPSTALPVAGAGANTTAYILTASQTQTTASATIGTLKLSSTAGTAQTLDLGTGALNMTLGGGTTSTPGAILIDGTAAWNINAATGTGTLTSSADLIFHQYNTTNGVTVNAGISGTGTNLVKAGPGLLTINGTNTFTGTVFVDEGVLSFSSVTAAGAGSLGNGSATAVTIRDGATLRYTGSTGSIASTGAGGHTFAFQGGNATIDVTQASTTLTLAGVVSGAGGLTKTGVGILQLNGATNTFTGPVFINQGTLIGGASNFITDNAPVTIAAAGTLDINGTAASQTETVGSISGSGTIVNSNTNTKTLAVGGDNTSTTFSGTFAAGGAAGNGFTKQGTGTLVLSGAGNTWTGTKSVNGGVLRFGVDQAFNATGGLIIANGALPSLVDMAGFNYSGGSLTFGGTSGASTAQGTLAIGTGTYTLGGTLTYTATGNPLAAFITSSGAGSFVMSAARSFNINDSTAVASSEYELTISAPITGAFAITKDLAGNLLLSGNNSFGGLIVQGAGMLTLTGDNTGLTSTTILNSGTLLLDYTTQNNTKLSTAGALSLLGGTLTLTGNAAANTSQSVASTTFASGAYATVNLNPGAGRQIALNLGALTRAAGGGTVRLNLPTGTQSATNGVITSTTNDATTGLVGTGGAWLTVTSSGDTSFATVSGGNIIPVTMVSQDNPTLWIPGQNITDSTGISATLDTEAGINSLRFNAATTSTLSIAPGGVLRIESGGILQTTNVTGLTTITGGRLVGSVGNELIFTIEGAQPLVLGSSITSTTLLNKSGTGTLRLSGFNTSTGAITIGGGTLELTGGFALGDTAAVTFPAFGMGSTLSLLAGQTETIGSLSGGAALGTASTTFTGLSTVALGTGSTLTINQTSALTYAGLITGAAGTTLVKTGSAALTLNAVTAFAGALVINGGQLTLNGNVNQFASISSITLSGPTSVLSLPNDQTTAVGSRIGDTVPITLNNTSGGLGLFMSRTAGTTTGTETVGTLTLGAGQNTITADGNAASRIGVIKFTSPLTRTNFSTALLLARNFDGVATQGGRIVFSADPGGAIGAGAAGAATGGTSYSIYPYLIGENTGTSAPATTNVGNSFVTFIDGTAGLRPLSITSEYILEAAGYNALTGAATNNVRFTASGTLTNAVTAVNSMVLDSASGITLTGPATALQITSGAILSAGAGANAISGFTAGITTTGAAVPYYTYVTTATGTLTINSALLTAAPLVAGGAGTLVLTNASNAFTDLYSNLGLVQADAVNKLGSGTLNFFGGGLKFGAVFDPSTKTINIGTGGATFDTGTNNITIANPMGNGGAGGLAKAGTGTLTLNATMAYLGGTSISAGRLVLGGGADNRLPTGAAVSLSGTSVLQLGSAAGASNQTVTELALTAATTSIVGGSTSVSTLTINQNTPITFAGIIGGAGTNENNIAIVKKGGGVLTLPALASTFTGGLTIKAGSVVGGSNAATFGAGPITLGDTSGSEDALIHFVNSGTYTNAITVVAGSTGAATIMAGTTTAAPVLSGPIALAKDLIISKQGTTGSMTISGGISGTGNLILDNFGTTGGITISTNDVSHLGYIKNAGVGATGTTTISANINATVTDIIQDSATSPLTLSGATIAYSGATIVSQGVLNITGSTATPLMTTSATVAGGATLNTNNTVGQTINLGSGALSLGLGTGTATLGLDLGSLSAFDNYITTGTATTANNVRINVVGLTGFGPGSYTVLTAAGGLGGAAYSIGSVSGQATGLVFSISATATAVTLTSTAAAAGDYYWKGAANTSWTGSSGDVSNFTSDLTGTTPRLLSVDGTPGINSSVIFSANGLSATTLSTTLDGQFSIRDLTFNNSVGSGPLGTITVATGLAGSSLKLTPTAPTSGINVQTGAPAAITISAPLILGASQSWTIADSATVLTASGGITGNGFVLNKEGPGTLVVSGAGLSTYTGQTNVNGGLLRAASATAFSAGSTYNVAATGTLSVFGFAQTIGALSGAAGAVVNNNTTTSVTLTLGGNNASTTYAGSLVDGSTGTLGLTKTGTGLFTLSGSATLTGTATLSGGGMRISGTLNNGVGITAIAGAAGTSGIMFVPTGGSLTTTTLAIGSNATAAGSLVISGGTVNITTPTVSAGVAAGNAGYGGLFMSSGSLTTNRFETTASVGTAAISVTQITGGTFTTNGDYILIRNGHSELTITGGQLIRNAPTNPICVGETGIDATLNLAGGFIDNSGQTVQFGRVASSIALASVNLNAGTLLGLGFASSSTNVTGQAVVNFNGGTLKASNTTTTLVSTAVTAAYVNGAFGTFAGGAVIDTNGFAITIPKALITPTGNGVSGLTLAAAGSGYIGAPLVQITGGGGTGATGYATVDLDPDSPTYGQVTGVVLTNPGVNYTSAPTVNLLGGGGTGASVTVNGVVANTSGGLTKVGAGTLTLTAVNTYTGVTLVSNGTLALGVSSALASAGTLNVNGGTFSTATFNNTVAGVTLQSGTITGTTGVLTSTTAYDLQSGTVSGILGGTVGITKTTAGTVTLSATNTFSGTVNANAGTLNFSTTGNLGNASATNTLAADGGTLAFTGAGALDLGVNRVLKLNAGGGTLSTPSSTAVLTLSGGIDPTGTGNLTKTGPGTVVISGSNSWNAGLSSVIVSDGTLRAGFGTGGINALTVGSTGVMSFQNSVAEALTLATGGITLSGGARLAFELGGTGVNDQIISSVAAAVSGTITLDFINLAGFGAGTYNLISASSGLDLATFALGSAPAGFNYTINQSATLISLGVVSFVPVYWTNSEGTNSWSTINGAGPFTSNWSTNAAGTANYGTTPQNADTVVFSATSVAGPVLSTTLDGSHGVDGLQFIAGSGTVTSTTIAAGSGGTLTLRPSSTSSGILVGANAGAAIISAPLVASTAGGAASQTWSVDGTGANGSSLNISGPVTFAAAVTKTGAGMLTLSGANSGSGAFTLSAGTLNINSATALGGGIFSIAPGTVINNTVGSTITLSTNNVMNWNGSFTFTGTNALNLGTGAVTLGLSTTVTTTASTLTIGGSIGDSGSSRSLIKDGAGTLTVGGNLSIGGGLTVNVGTATFGGTTNSIGGAVTASGTALTMNGASTIGGGVSVTAGTATMNGANSITGAVAVTGGTLTLGGANSVSGSVAVNGGTLALNAANTISGGVTLTSGTLNLANAGALGANTFSVLGGTLNNTSGGTLTLSTNNAMAWNGSFTFTGTNSLNLGTGGVTLNISPTITVTANTLTVGGIINDGTSTFGITKAGAGTMRLGAANIYSGATVINQGTLALDVTQNLAASTNNLTFGASAGSTNVGTLDLASGVNATFGGVFTVQTSSASSNIINVPAGQTLRFNNTFNVGYNSSGNTTTKLSVTGGGTLTIGAAGQPINNSVAIGNGATDSVSNAATLDLTGLGVFYANLGSGTFRVGSGTNGTGTAAAGSTLILAPDSTIIATTITSDSTDSVVNQAIKLGTGTNVLNATTITIGGSSNRASGTLDFFNASGSVVIRNLAGNGRAAMNVQNGSASTGTSLVATVDFTGHNADLLLGTLAVGGRSAQTTANGTGTFSFDTGTLDATTLNIAARTGSAATTGSVTGTVNLGGGTSVIGTVTMSTNSASTATSTGDATSTLNISGGTNTITTLTMGVLSVAGASAVGSDTSATLNITGGATTVSTTLTMGANNAATTVGTNVNTATSALNISAGSLTLGGTTNLTMGATTLNAVNVATSTISITGTGVLTVGGNIAYTNGLGTENNTITLNGGTLDMTSGTIGAATALITLNLQSGTLRNLADFNGGAALVKSTSGVLVLDGTNAYVGNTTFAVGGGTIRLGASNVIPDGSGKGNLDTTNGIVDMNGFSDTVNGLIGTGLVQNLAAATTSTLTVGGNNTASTFNGTLQNGVGILALGKTGTGILTLATANTYTGGTTINNGIIVVTNPAALGTGAVTFTGSAIRLVGIAGQTIANDINLGTNNGASGQGLVEAEGVTGVTTFSGNINITAAAAAGNHFAAPTAGSVLNLTGVITSTVPVGTRIGTVVLSGGGTGYTDLQNNQGTTAIGANNGIATTATVTLAMTAAGNLDLAGFNQSLVGIVKSGSTATIGNSSTTSDSTLTITGTSNYAGIIADVLGSGTRKTLLVVNSNGTLTLSGVNTYSGATSVTAGTLALASSGSIANSTVNIDGATGVLDISGLSTGTATIGSLAGVSGGSVILGSKLLSTGGNNSSTTFAGTASGTGGAVTKTGTGTMTLSGANTYTGATTVTGGTLQVGNGTSGSIAAASSVSVGASGTLAVNLASNATFSNTVNNSGVVTAVGANTNTFGGTIFGAGSFLQAGAGTTFLTGTNTFTGTTTVQSGTLVLAGGAALADTAAVTVSSTPGATLQLNASETIGSLSGSGAVSLGSSTLTVGNATDTTYSGVISGTGSVVKQGSGALTLSGSSTYTGKTSITAGKLSISSEDNLGADPAATTADQLLLNGGTLQTTATLAIDDAHRGITVGASGGTIETATGTTTTIASVILGGGDVTKAGTGTLIYTAVNANTGTTNVNAGILGGTGTVGGNLVINNTGTVAPGVTGAGQLTVTGNLVINTGGTLALELGGTTFNAAAIVANEMNANGNLNAFRNNLPSADWENYINGSTQHDHLLINGATASVIGGLVKLSSLPGGYTPAYGDIFDLLDWASSNAPTGTPTFDFTSVTLDGGLAFNTDLFLSDGIIVVVPEPSRVLLLLLGLLGLMLRRRRRL